MFLETFVIPFTSFICCLPCILNIFNRSRITGDYRNNIRRMTIKIAGTTQPKICLNVVLTNLFELEKNIFQFASVWVNRYFITFDRTITTWVTKIRDVVEI